MDSSFGHGQHRPCTPKVPEPPHCQFHHFHHHSLLVPHHHHFHVSPHCPLHSYMLHSRPGFVPWHPPSLNPETLASAPFPENPLRLQVSQSKETIFNTLVMHEEETLEMEEEREQHEEEEEDDPVFVLTDEWREFFAKSEAKRRLAKKQARKQEKNRMEQ